MYIIWLSNLLIMNIPDEVYSRNASISTFLQHVFLLFMSIVLYDIIHYTKKGDLGPYTYFNPPRFIAVAVTSQESDRPK
jgi:hypothetical protein